MGSLPTLLMAITDTGKPDLDISEKSTFPFSYVIVQTFIVNSYYSYQVVICTSSSVINPVWGSEG